MRAGPSRYDGSLLSRFIRKEETYATHRSKPIKETLDGLALPARLAGVTRLCNVTGLDRIGLPVTMAVRPLSRSLSVWQGKSATLDGAKVSGLMEAIETFCAESPPRSFADATLMDLEPSSVAWCKRLNKYGIELTKTIKIGWLRGYDLIANQDVMVPRSIVGHAMHQRKRQLDLSVLGTNGLASGNELIEAVLHGVCELIERDAEAKWNAAARSARRQVTVDLATIDDPLCMETIRRFEKLKINVLVYDATSSIGVPCFITQIDDADSAAQKLGRFVGAGCHPDPSIALFRSLSEAAQSRLTSIVGAREDLNPTSYTLAGILKPLIPGPDPTEVPRRFKSSRGYSSNDVSDDLLWVLRQMKDAGINHAIFVDLTDGEIKVPVVRVLAPELQNFRHGLISHVSKGAASAMR